MARILLFEWIHHSASSVLYLTTTFRPPLSKLQFGSFVTNSENKYDFFDTCPHTQCIIVPPLPNTRIPIFPEDFPPNGKKEWPLKWWGIVEPSEELTALHERAAEELGYPVGKRQKVSPRSGGGVDFDDICGSSGEWEWRGRHCYKCKE